MKNLGQHLDLEGVERIAKCEFDETHDLLGDVLVHLGEVKEKELDEGP